MIRSFYGLTQNPFDQRELELLPQQREIHDRSIASKAGCAGARRPRHGQTTIHQLPISAMKPAKAKAKSPSLTQPTHFTA
jgi:hypothetical protein